MKIMTYSRILVAYDGSDLAKKALDEAVLLTSCNPTTEIHVVHVVKIVKPVTGGEFGVEKYVNENMYKEGEEVLAGIKDFLSRIPNPVKTFVIGDYNPSDAIISHAKEDDCDLIVMGSRGLGGIKMFLGSVSHTVIQRSEISVLIVK